MKAKQNPEAVRALVTEIVRVSGVLQRAAARLFAPWEVSLAQFNALNLIVLAPNGVRATEITHLLVVDPSSTTYLLDQLETRGWITRTRDTADRRALRLIPTRRGRTLHSQLAGAYLEALEQLAHEMGDLPTTFTQQLTSLGEGADKITQGTNAGRK